MAKELERMGAHVLAIKDMAGLCRPYAAEKLVRTLKQEIGIPVHFHTHDTSGVNAASILKASEAGLDVADAAVASMSGTTSQPNMNSVVAALAHTSRATGLDLDLLNQYSDYWETVRTFYAPFDNAPPSGTADVYVHEMPGGQYTNLREQADAMGLADRWRDIARTYADVNRAFGDIVKVTPSSKVVGDMALFMVTNNLSADDIVESTSPLSFPRSVVEMMQGMLGSPDGGWPRAFQDFVLRSAHVKAIEGRPGASMPPADFEAAAQDIRAKTRQEPRQEDVLSYLLYPQVFMELMDHQLHHGDTSSIPTAPFFYGLQAGQEIAIEIERGKTLIVRYLTTGDVRDDGTRTVFFELNGQPRDIRVVDRSVEAALKRHPKADAADPGHIAAPMPGKVSTVVARAGQRVKAGDRLLSIEAMKMETAVYSPREAKVTEVLVSPGSVIEARDLLVVLQDA
jgi:pyruvate carboxylase